MRRKKETKEERIRKLGKVRVWPSIIVLIINLVVMFAAVVAIGEILYTLVVDDMLAVDYGDAREILKSVCAPEEQGDELDIDLIVNHMKNGKLSAVNIYNAKNESVLSIGGEFDREQVLYKAPTVENTRKLYITDNEQVGWDEDFYEMVQSTGRKENEDFDNEEIDEKVFEDAIVSYPVWIEYGPIKNGYRIFVRTKLILTLRIVSVYVAIYGIIVFITLFPLSVMISNAIKHARINRKMRKLLFTDIETGASNWLSFEHFGSLILNKRKNRFKTFAVVDVEIVDLNHFITYYGNRESEALLEDINRYFCSKIFKKDELVAYIPKSKFSFLMPVKDLQEAKTRVESILNGYIFKSKCHHMCLHAGIYMVAPQKGGEPRRGLKLDEYYNDAAMARRSISDIEGNSIIEFNNDLLDEQLWEHKVEDHIDEAIAKEEFKVYIQPKYDPVQEKLVGAEALIRWVSETEGFVPPGKFIPIYEKNGLIKKIDDYMLDNVAKLQAKWLQDGKQLVPISVNVSRIHFADEDLAEHIRDIVDRYQVPHKYIEIELTESAFLDDKDMILETVRRLKEYGFEVSMDDFGTGYSSLNSLKDLNLDVLKLDAEFFRGEADGDRAKIVISDAISLAKHLGMRVVAEGIEKKEQVEFLADAGCDMIQGYYYSKPVPTHEYEEKMSSV